MTFCNCNSIQLRGELGWIRNVGANSNWAKPQPVEILMILGTERPPCRKTCLCPERPETWRPKLQLTAFSGWMFVDSAQTFGEHYQNIFGLLRLLTSPYILNRCVNGVTLSRKQHFRISKGGRHIYRVIYTYQFVVSIRRVNPTDQFTGYNLPADFFLCWYSAGVKIAFI